MTVAGALLLILGFALGEAGAWHLTPAGAGSLAYLDLHRIARRLHRVRLRAAPCLRDHRRDLRVRESGGGGPPRLARPPRTGDGQDDRGDGGDSGRGTVDPAHVVVAATKAEPRARRAPAGRRRAENGVSAAGLAVRRSQRTPRVLELIREFEACTLPKRPWNHRAHLTVALWYAAHLEPDDALDAVRRGIHRLNEACGVVSTPTSGYHETITRFYMRVVGNFVETEPEGDWAARANRLYRAIWRERPTAAALQQDRLMSMMARAGLGRARPRPAAIAASQISSAGQQRSPELGHPAAHRAVVDPLAHPDDRPAQNLGPRRTSRSLPCRAACSARPESSAAATRRPGGPASRRLGSG